MDRAEAEKWAALVRATVADLVADALARTALRYQEALLLDTQGSEAKALIRALIQTSDDLRDMRSRVK
jgi:hypothetical protein